MIKRDERGREVYIYEPGETIRQAELQIAGLVLRQNGRNRTKTAKDLGIAIRTLGNWIRFDGLERNDVRPE